MTELNSGVQYSIESTEVLYCIFFSNSMLGTAVVYWLSSWIAEQEVRDSIPGLAATISEIEYLLLPSRDMAEKSPFKAT